MYRCGTLTNIRYTAVWIARHWVVNIVRANLASGKALPKGPVPARGARAVS